jgi:hypothetical protein
VKEVIEKGWRMAIDTRKEWFVRFNECVKDN